MPADRPLEDCEELVVDGDELQWRQVHPRNVDGQIVSQDAFVGGGSGDLTQQVSTSRASVVTAEAAFEYHTGEMARESAGTWGVTVDEIAAAGSRLVDDSDCPGVDTPGHGYIDLRGLDKLERKAARAQLATAATSRGRLHP